MKFVNNAKAFWRSRRHLKLRFVKLLISFRQICSYFFSFFSRLRLDWMQAKTNPTSRYRLYKTKLLSLKRCERKFKNMFGNLSKQTTILNEQKGADILWLKPLNPKGSFILFFCHIVIWYYYPMIYFLWLSNVVLSCWYICFLPAFTLQYLLQCRYLAKNWSKFVVELYQVYQRSVTS